jgi:carbonic anhydrase/acetyltransferase-like protein (isoleucine patch superfamily)
LIIEHRGFVPQISASAFIAPTAIIVGDVRIGERASIWFGAVLRAEGGTIRIEDGVAVEDNAVIHADEGDITILGKGATVGHGAMLDGCTIGPHAQIGGNAVVLHGACVGEGAILASGSVVVAGGRIEDNSFAIGAPAIGDDAARHSPADFIPHTAQDNVHLASVYRREGLGDPALQSTPTSYGRSKRHIISHEEETAI